RCSKSRESLNILEKAQVHFEVIEYLKNPLSESELQEVLRKLDRPAKDLLRTKESVFQELNIDLENDKEIIKAISEHPILLERPIVVSNNRAVIGRPPENVLDLL
ncbi:MAG: arsenate reductase (glutaredoxin), partial [Bacteriovoracaceae bacterium]